MKAPPASWLRARFPLLAVVAVAALAVPRPQAELQAMRLQFWLTTEGDGWDCKGCCSTGMCCTVPIDGCQQEPI